MEAYLEPDARPRATAEKYQVHVHLDLCREADGPVDDPEAPALAQETVRRLGCEANLVAIQHDGEKILSVGRKTRAIPPAIRRALRLRDRGCRFPGCTHTRHVDAHHIQHWADGGETKLSNLVELCGRHHRLLHEGGYGLRLTDDGALVFTRPDGERIPDVPRAFVLEGGGDPGAVAAEAAPADVTAVTCGSHWDGKPPDYGAMVEMLDTPDQAWYSGAG
jgi:5-methylcytosine-specific restriction endonuclease McrA